MTRSTPLRAPAWSTVGWGASARRDRARRFLQDGEEPRFVIPVEAQNVRALLGLGLACVVTGLLVLPSVLDAVSPAHADDLFPVIAIPLALLLFSLPEAVFGLPHQVVVTDRGTVVLLRVHRLTKRPTDAVDRSTGPMPLGPAYVKTARHGWRTLEEVTGHRWWIGEGSPARIWVFGTTFWIPQRSFATVVAADAATRAAMTDPVRP